MTQSDLKKRLEELVSSYFGGATVTWGNVKAVSANVPQVVLSMGGVDRHYMPIRQTVDGVIVDSYPSQTTLQVDLYTKGAATSASPGITAAYENTAVNDMADFANFLNSAYVDGWGAANDISIMCNQVQDLTELINDVSWDYRAMIELNVAFTQSAVGSTGTMYEGGVSYYENGRPRYDADGYALDEHGNYMLDGEGNRIRLPLDGDGKPIFPAAGMTPSGGGARALADQSTGWFERVDGPEYEKED